MRSKEDKVLELFFNEPTRQWHFEEIIQQVQISRKQGTRWLKKFVRQYVVQRVKPRGRMPYYVADYTQVAYQNKKSCLQ